MPTLPAPKKSQYLTLLIQPLLTKTEELERDSEMRLWQLHYRRKEIFNSVTAVLTVPGIPAYKIVQSIKADQARHNLMYINSIKHVLEIVQECSLRHKHLLCVLPHREVCTIADSLLKPNPQPILNIPVSGLSINVSNCKPFIVDTFYFNKESMLSMR